MRPCLTHFRALWGVVGPCGVLWGIFENAPQGIIWAHKDLKVPHKALFGLGRPCETLFDSFQGLVGSCGVLWGLVGSCGVFLKIPHKVLCGPTRP